MNFLLGIALVMLLATLPSITHVSSKKTDSGGNAEWNLHESLSHCLEESHAGDLPELHWLVI